MILVIGVQIGGLPQSQAYNAGPDAIGTWYPANSLDPVMDVSVNDSIVYLAVDSYGLQILNVSDPTNPTPIGSKVISGTIKTITYANGNVYMGIGDKLHIYDVTNPSSIPAGTIIDQWATVYGIAVQGQYIFISAQSGSLMIANHTHNLYAQDHSMWVRNNYWVYDVVVTSDGNYAYTATSAKGLTVFDISTKNAPQVWGELTLGDNVYAIGLIDDNTVLLGGRAGYIAKCDTTARDNPSKLGDLDTTSDIGRGKGISISGTIAFLADYSLGITNVFISGNTPAENTRLKPTARGYGVENDATNVYGALGFSGFAVWNKAAAISGFDWGSIPGFEIFFIITALFAIILIYNLKRTKTTPI